MYLDFFISFNVMVSITWIKYILIKLDKKLRFKIDNNKVGYHKPNSEPKNTVNVVRELRPR